VEAIKQFTLQTSNFSAEYGFAGEGGQNGLANVNDLRCALPDVERSYISTLHLMARAKWGCG
jgi:hypothetical protein